MKFQFVLHIDITLMLMSLFLVVVQLLFVLAY